MEFREHVGKAGLHLAGENSACSDVVAVAKPTWKTEDLIISDHFRGFNQLVNVDETGVPSRQIKSVTSFLIAISSGSSQDKYVRLRHGEIAKG